MYQMLIVRFSVSVLSAVNEVIIGGVEPNAVTPDCSGERSSWTGSFQGVNGITRWRNTDAMKPSITSPIDRTTVECYCSG